MKVSRPKHLVMSHVPIFRNVAPDDRCRKSEVLKQMLPTALGRFPARHFLEQIKVNCMPTI